MPGVYPCDCILLYAAACCSNVAAAGKTDAPPLGKPGSMWNQITLMGYICPLYSYDFSTSHGIAIDHGLSNILYLDQML